MTSHFSIKFVHTCISYERNSFNNTEIVSETDSESELLFNLSEVTFLSGQKKWCSIWRRKHWNMCPTHDLDLLLYRKNSEVVLVMARSWWNDQANGNLMEPPRGEPGLDLVFFVSFSFGFLTSLSLTWTLLQIHHEIFHQIELCSTMKYD